MVPVRVRDPDRVPSASSASSVSGPSVRSVPAPQSRRIDEAAHSIMIADSPRRDEGFAEPVPRKVRSGPSPLSSAGAGGSCVEINH